MKTKLKQQLATTPPTCGTVVLMILFLYDHKNTKKMIRAKIPRLQLH